MRFLLKLDGGKSCCKSFLIAVYILKKKSFFFLINRKLAYNWIQAYIKHVCSLHLSDFSWIYVFYWKVDVEIVKQYVKANENWKEIAVNGYIWKKTTKQFYGRSHWTYSHIQPVLTRFEVDGKRENWSKKWNIGVECVI